MRKWPGWSGRQGPRRALARSPPRGDGAANSFASARPYAKAVGVGLFVVSFFDNIVTSTAQQYYLWSLAGLLIGAEQEEGTSTLPSEGAIFSAGGGASDLRGPEGLGQPL